MREYIGGNIGIDGRQIPFRIFTADCYLRAKGYSIKQLDRMYDLEYKKIQVLNQIIALKQACFLMRRVNNSCGSLSDDLCDLKNRLIVELKEKYNFDFDEEFVDETYDKED